MFTRTLVPREYRARASRVYAALDYRTFSPVPPTRQQRQKIVFLKFTLVYLTNQSILFCSLIDVICKTIETSV